MNIVEIKVTRTAIEVRGDGIRKDLPLENLQSLDSALVDLWTLMADSSVSRMTVGAEQLGVLVLDASGTPLSSIMWADDTRSADDAAWCNKKFPADWWTEHIGETPRTRHGITKLSWLHRSEPDVWEKMSRICGIEDFVRWKIHGAPLADLVISQSTMAAMGWGTSTQVDVDVLGLIDSERDWTIVVPRWERNEVVLGSRNGVEIAM